MAKKAGKKMALGVKEEGGKVKITTIPKEFYGGANPQIYDTATVAQPSKEKSKKVEAPATPTAPPTAGPVPQVKTQKSRLPIIIVASLSFVLIVVLVSWYYIRQATPQVSDTQTGDEIVFGEEVVQEDVTTEQEVEDSGMATTTEPEAEQEQDLEESGVLQFPRIILVDSVDLDADSLTDSEEITFDTQVGLWDTDGDGFYDGQEIVNLYDPKKVTPAKLIDSGTIREYVNPNYSYRLYYPVTWQEGAVDPNSDQVLFSDINGDYVSVTAVDKGSGQTFEDWFSENAPEQRLADVITLTNRFGVGGYKRQDNLVAYFVTTNKVFVLIFTPGESGLIANRHVAIMIMQSFRPPGSEGELTDDLFEEIGSIVNSATTTP